MHKQQMKRHFVVLEPSDIWKPKIIVSNRYEFAFVNSCYFCNSNERSNDIGQKVKFQRH